MTSKVKLLGSILAIVTVWGVQFQHLSTGGATMALTITSAAFKEGGMIPKRYTCDGSDVSPDLSWSAVPQGTQTLALICDDPDAPAGTWVHWVLFNIPADVASLPEGVPPEKILPNGARHGKNDFRKFGYGGPCPPGGTHRYYFKLYALDTALDLEAGIAKSRLVDAMKGHILAEGQLMGKYRR
jgi:Raf kinase inhibitor-like YbhB/YbcL family protein